MSRIKYFSYLAALILITAVSVQIRSTPAAVAEGGIVFIDSGQFLGNGFSTDVALGDLDGDGDQDAIVTNSGASPNEIWWNQGGVQGGTEGLFVNLEDNIGDQTQRGLALADLDGDLDLDVFLVRGIAADSYQVWLNQGGVQGGTEGSFVKNGLLVNDDLGSNIVLGDVDGDSDLDAYIPRIFDADQLYLNDGSGFFTNSGQNLETADSQGADFGDVDGDGDLDFFVAVNNGANAIWLNQGGLQGGTEGVFLDSGQTIGSRISLNVVLADLDNDTDLDAFVANATENIVWVNQGGGQGGTAGVFLDSGQLLGFSGSLDVKTADFDGDNDLDAFVSESGANKVWVNQGGLQGGTTGVFSDSGLALGNAFSTGVALADVDGDADIDAFVANSSPAPNRVYLNDSAVLPAPVNPEGWQIQLLETRGDTGNYPTIATDSSGYPHIAYVQEINYADGTSHRLNHLYWDGIRWHNDLIVSADWLPGIPALALDSNDNPHVAFVASPQGMVHGFWDGSDWQFQPIESGDVQLQWDISLALDSNDNPHVSYAVQADNNPSDEFRYAAWNGTAWQIQVIDAVTLFRSSYTSLALDSNDRPHIAYNNSDDDALNHAYFDGSSWQINTIDDTSFFPGSYPFFSLAVAGTTPSIVYQAGSFGADFYYGVWNGTSWLTERIITLNFPIGVTGKPGLVMDSAGKPHISFSYTNFSTFGELRYATLNGNTWQIETLDNSGRLGIFSNITLDPAGKAHIAYYDQTYRDLRYVSWDNDWQLRTVPDPGAFSSADIDIYNRIPYLTYHNQADDLLNLANWDDSWLFNPADGVNNPVTQVSLAVTPNGQYVSYYDADTGDLRYGRHNEFGWQLLPVDVVGDIGRYNQLIVPANMEAFARIAYWDETNRRVKLAVYRPLSDTFDIHINTAGPGMAVGSGPLSAAGLADGDIGIAYYDAANSGLRFATWQLAANVWSDELVDAAGGDMGRLNSTQADGNCGCPVVAYYDETNDAIKISRKEAEGWTFETAVPDAGGVTGLSLELGLESMDWPRLSYTTANAAHFAYKSGGSWVNETIAEGLNNLFMSSLALNERPHMAYPDALDGLQYGFRTATLDVDTAVPGPPIPTGGAYNPLTPCPVIFDFIFNGDGLNRPGPVQWPFLFVGEAEPFDDDSVFAGMAGLFNVTTGGAYYVDLYAVHAAEMGQIGLNDPQLMWDGFGALQNFMPGLQGLVTGDGDQYLVTQEMVDDALDIWSRIAAAASPQLASVINTELAQYNNLQDFVGLSFDEWALAIGVNPPADNIYLPVIVNN